MQATNSSSVQYAPAPVPNDPAELRHYIESELRNIQSAILALAAGHLDEANVAPNKPRNGDIRYADGTNWNPGSGRGIYYFNGTAWRPLDNGP